MFRSSPPLRDDGPARVLALDSFEGAFADEDGSSPAVGRVLDLGDDDNDWDDNAFATPPRTDSGSAPNSPTHLPFTSPPARHCGITLNFDEGSPLAAGGADAPDSPQSPEASAHNLSVGAAAAAAVTPRRGLAFGRQGSYLKLGDAPCTPRSLLHRAGSSAQETRRRQQQQRSGVSADGRPGTAPATLHPTARPANENPFTPSLARSKRSASPLHDTDPDSMPAPPGTGAGSIFASPYKRRHKGGAERPRDSRSGANISRFHQEFEQVGELGAGEFGTVLKCKNRLDGTMYAIKRSKKKITGMKDEQHVLREVYAHAVVETQPHIVRYHSAWEEDDHMLIQNEYCDGGSLESVIETRLKEGSAFPEEAVVQILKHVCLGLRSLHGKRLAHLDIKPGNVFLKSEEAADGDTPRAESLPEGDGAAAGSEPSGGAAAAAAAAAFNESRGGVAIQSPMPQAMDISPAIVASSHNRPRSDAFSIGRPPSFVVTPSSLGDRGTPRSGAAAAVAQAAADARGGAGAFGASSSRPAQQNIMRAPSTPREGSIRPMQTVYKIGDLGHVTRTDEPSVEEGDTRYLAKELLAENYGNLTKADIFSTGIMVHELASCNPLPMNGDEWHKLRDGAAPHLPRYSANFNSLIESMLHPDPMQRPSANAVLSHPALVQERKVPGLQKSKKQLYNELNAEKMDKFRIMTELQTLKQKDPLARVITQGGRGSGLHRRNSAPSRPMRHSSACW